MQERWARILGRERISFDEAFQTAAKHVEVLSTSAGHWLTANHGEFLCFQAAAGSFIWRHRRKEYHFSIYGGLQRGLPVQSTCPSLRVALHTTELKRSNRRGHYEDEAKAIMAAGLCSAAAAQGKLRTRLFHLCRILPKDSQALLAVADDVPSWSWTSVETGYCGRRSLPELLADFWRLQAKAPERGAIKATLRQLLAANATGRYTADHSLDPHRRLEVVGI